MSIGFLTTKYEVQASNDYNGNMSVGKNNNNDINTVDDKIDGYEKYLIDDGETVTFDLELALKNNESSEMITFGEVFNSLAEETNQSAENEIATANFIYDNTRYGNWCGRGNNGRNPLDVLDLACMQHDKCYDRNGRDNPYCDRVFVRRLKTIRNNGYSVTLGTYARVYLNAAIAYFS